MSMCACVVNTYMQCNNQREQIKMIIKYSQHSFKHVVCKLQAQLHAAVDDTDTLSAGIAKLQTFEVLKL